MQRTRTMPTLRPRNRHQRLVGKELDLLLLAGCSCLLTILYHPTSTAVQHNQTASGSSTAIATQISKAPLTLGSLHLTLPPERENLEEEAENS